MGIRFFCPQGHKLNVKSFLAGKIGVCPHCDARVKIPLTSTRPSSKAMYRDAEVPEEALPLASPLEDLDHVLEVAEIAGLSGTDSASKSPSAAGSVTELESVPADMPEPGPTDPLLQSPEAQWYVCPEPGGKNYGPATAEVMRQWIKEQRIFADYLVWRSGWKEWQRAGDCFANLNNQRRPGQFNGQSSQ
ncbi:MAG: hypothetical protein CMJ74_08005 [Planctomycetaceae bacterium]|nr:hypothetical protein [Planctomycetaceae bacterium]|tara:strand:+ start:141 stop:710 length:570 start_codon:yes stop_codon:yes gene_type:complete